jgi:4-carboxymuconolactone decarboxylase
MPARPLIQAFDVAPLIPDLESAGSPSERPGDPWSGLGSKRVEFGAPIAASQGSTNPGSVNTLTRISGCTLSLGRSALAAGTDVPHPFQQELHMNRDAFEKGLKTRREVLGAEYVDASIKNADAFNQPMQELVTEYCWNEIKTRSIINLALLTALNRPHELKLHVRGAINNGLTKDEIQEVFLQTAIYCGVPAAIDSFRNAKEVFKDMDL